MASSCFRLSTDVMTADCGVALNYNNLSRHYVQEFLKLALMQWGKTCLLLVFRKLWMC